MFHFYLYFKKWFHFHSLFFHCIVFLFYFFSSSRTHCWRCGCCPNGNNRFGKSESLFPTLDTHRLQKKASEAIAYIVRSGFPPSRYEYNGCFVWNCNVNLSCAAWTESSMNLKTDRLRIVCVEGMPCMRWNWIQAKNTCSSNWYKSSLFMVRKSQVFSNVIPVVHQRTANIFNKYRR